MHFIEKKMTSSPFDELVCQVVKSVTGKPYIVQIDVQRLFGISVMGLDILKYQGGLAHASCPFDTYKP